MSYLKFHLECMTTVGWFVLTLKLLAVSSTDKKWLLIKSSKIWQKVIATKFVIKLQSICALESELLPAILLIHSCMDCLCWIPQWCCLSLQSGTRSRNVSLFITLPQTLVGPVVYAVSCLCRSPKTEAQSSAEGWTGSVRVRVLCKLFCVWLCVPQVLLLSFLLPPQLCREIYCKKHV